MKVETSRLLHLISELERAGASRAVVSEVLSQAGLKRQDVNASSGSYDYQKEVLFVQKACDALGDITFGAKAGLSWGLMGELTDYIGKYSKDLRSAIEAIIQFQDLVNPALGAKLRISGNSAVIEFFWKDASFAKYHRHTEFVVFGSLCWLREVTRTNLFPLLVQFDHDVRKSADAFQKLAGSSVNFGMDTVELLLPTSVLDLPIPSYDPRLRNHLIAYANTLLNKESSKSPSLRSRIEGLLMAALPGKLLSSDEVAASLGMSQRTLGRRLKDGGVTYREIVDTLRYDLAITFLQDDMSMSEISFALGYSDQSAFSTAFKRWTGKSPRDFEG
ncbi:MAG: helix-turn-helix domain-containing protein [Shimia sp.]|uniref:AraC family transcriptional regulator n=1 Tax=Shimia sp. TaxID=1954381 RepID=UPI003B8BFEE7